MGNGTELGRVRGLGSAKSGVHHWWMQRISAVANVVLLPWLAISLLRLPAFDHKTVVEWIGSPLVTVPLLLVVANLFWHLRLGLQVFIEDYVHEEGNKVAALLALNFYAVAGAALGIFSILRIAFAGTAA